MGFPTFADCAAAAGVPMFKLDCTIDEPDQISNLMHVANVGCVMVAVLASVAFEE